jgi:general L-amino acid transport system substrate-binding protein
MSRIPCFLFALFVLIASIHPSAHASPAASTLDKIRASGSLACGVDFEEVEYTLRDAHGNHSLFDIDICRAIAVAVLGPNAKFTVVPYRDEADAIEGLKAGKFAVLATASTNLLDTSNAALGFGPTIFFDYQGLLVNKTMGIATPRDLAGKKICFLGGTEIQVQIEGYMAREKIKWLPFPFSEEGEMEAAFMTSNCAAITADTSQLAYERIAFKGMARNFAILPDVIAKDPLSPAYRRDDPQWALIVNWVVEALIQAEESGVTQANVAAMQKSDDPIIMRLLGTQHGYGQYLGLDDAWAANVIGAVGNYGEMFERDLGAGSVMKLDRGANKLWTKGGLMYSSPIR